jgi:hypothetical protein
MTNQETQARTYDCPATLTDTQVLDFCKNGYLMLEGVVPDQINRQASEYVDSDDFYEPTDILTKDWFHQEVILNPEAAGAVRSLLGANFHLPVLMSNHRVKCPMQGFGGWHVDGNFEFSHELNYLQVFYYPQDTPLEMGPTQIVPGSHLIRNKARFMSHLGSIRNAVPTIAPAGSIFLTVYHIWHRRGPSTALGVRNLLKYFYWRTTPPHRDWCLEPDFDFATANYGPPTSGFTEQFRGDIKVAEMFLWLCSQHRDFQNLGGQSWPLPAHRNDLPYGFPEGLPHRLKTPPSENR